MSTRLILALVALAVPRPASAQLLGGPVSEGTGVAVSAGTSELIVVIGTDGNLWVKQLGANGAFTPSGTTWSLLGSAADGTPLTGTAAVADLDGLGTRYLVFARGVNGQLYQGTFSQTNLHAYPKTMGGSFTGDPVAVVPYANRVNLFIRAYGSGPNAATEGPVFEQGVTFNLGVPAWDGWSNLGGIVRGPLATASANPGTVMVVARGTDDQLWYNAWSPGWGWHQIPEGIALSSTAAVTSVTERHSSGNNVIHVFVEIAGGGYLAQYSSADAGVTWQWSRVDVYDGMEEPWCDGSPIVATSRPCNHAAGECGTYIDLFVRCVGTLYHMRKLFPDSDFAWRWHLQELPMLWGTAQWQGAAAYFNQVVYPDVPQQLDFYYLDDAVSAPAVTADILVSQP